MLTLELTPGLVTLQHGQEQQFNAVLDGTVVNSDPQIQWSVVGVGTVNAGLYKAPDVILPDETSVVVRVEYVPLGLVEEAQVTLGVYTPPSGHSVSPSSGAGLSQNFLFQVSEPQGAENLISMEIEFRSPTDPGDSCYLRVKTDTLNPTLVDTAELRIPGNGFIGPAYIGAQRQPSLGNNGIIEVAQCRLDGPNSSVTREGNTLKVRLALTFRPGFIGNKTIHVGADNRLQNFPALVQVGQWDLTANIPSVPPNITLDAPAAGAVLQGVVAVSGWAIDSVTRIENPIAGIELSANGTSIGSATYGGVRSDVCTATGGAYPGRPGCPNVGFNRYWDTCQVPNGLYTLTARATDADYPARTAEVHRTVTVSNSNCLGISPQTAPVRKRYWPDLIYSVEQQQFLVGEAFFQDSFATAPIPAQYSTVSSGTLGPWTVGGAGIDRIGAYWQAGDGDGASIDLNGNGPGWISTVLSSKSGWTSGATYRVSFSLAGNPDTLTYAPGATQAGVRVTTANSSKDFYFDVSNIDLNGTDASRPNMGWKRHYFDFVGAVSDTLKFTSLDPAGDQWGPALDNVVVEKFVIPSNVSWAIQPEPQFNQAAPNGTLTASGLYTGPNALSSREVGARLTLTGSVQDDKSGTATIVIRGVLSPHEYEVTNSTPVYHFAETPLTGFTVTPAIGSIDSSGVYFPPASNSTPVTLTIEAKAQSDNSKVYVRVFTLGVY